MLTESIRLIRHSGGCGHRGVAVSFTLGDCCIFVEEICVLVEMSGLKFYYDLMSQPSRAVFLFLKATDIPFIAHKVALRKRKLYAP